MTKLIRFLVNLTKYIGRATAVLAFILFIISGFTNAYAQTPTYQNFEDQDFSDYSDTELDIDGIRYIGGPSTDRYVAIVSEGDAGLHSDFSGKAILFGNMVTETDGYAEFYTIDNSQNFKLASLSIGTSSGSEDYATDYTIIGYDNGIQKVAVDVNMLSSGTYGNGNDVITYTLNYSAGENTAGTFEFGSSWENIDQVRFQAKTPANAYYWVGLDDIAFEDPVEATLPTFAGGAGTEVDPYQVETAEHLDSVRDYLDSHFIQTADIDLGVSPWNEDNGWEPLIGECTQQDFGGNCTGYEVFTGVYDGQGYKIQNLYTNRGSEAYIGLFSTIGTGGQIKNMGIENANVSGGSSAGILAGRVVGEVHQSYSTGSVYGNYNIGGLIGYSGSGSKIYNSYSTASVTVSNNGGGGLTGVFQGDLIEDSYASGAITGTGNNKGGLVGEFVGNEVRNSFYDRETSGMNGGYGTPLSSLEMKTKTIFTGAGWDFDTVWQIGEPQDINNTYPYLKNNLLDPPPGYSGPQSPEVVTNTTIENITSESASLSGEVTNDGGDPVTERGFVYATSSNPTTADTKKQVGSGTGVFEEDITGLSAETTYYVRAYAINGEGTSYGSEESFTTQSIFAGGAGTEANPYQVETPEQLDAVRDYLDAHFIQTADIDLGVSPWNDGDGWEPLKGECTQYDYFSGDCSLYEAFTGVYDGQGYKVQNLYINRTNFENVGLFSYTDRGSLLENIGVENANVTGDYVVGILAGRILGDVNYSYSTGSVQGDEYIGGLIGSSSFDSRVLNSYSTASVTVATFAGGGLVGLFQGSLIENNYASGEVSGTGDSKGGLVARDQGADIINSFYDRDTSGMDGGNGTPSSNLEMKTKSTFTGAGWDFDTVWQIGEPQDSNNSYPYLQSNTQNPAPGYIEPQSPEVITNTIIENITSESATLSGNVTDDGGAAVTERGFVYATTSGPTTSDTKIQAGSGTGAFEEDITGLSAETTYYVRAYAINGAGTSYGSEESFTTTTLRTDITITSSASSGSGWSISGGELTATSSVSVNFQDIENALDGGDLIILSSQDIIIDADIAPALSAERTLTLKADRDINLESNSSIAATGFALNTILWSDADASEGGVVYLKNQAEILTHGGHLWIGGGDGSTIWNGLTVGNGTAIGNTNNSNGVTIVNSSIQTDGGNIAFYGKGLPGAVAGVSIPISTGSSTNTNGIRMHDGNVINAGSGTIYMYGFADNSHSTSNANGIELSQTAGAGDVITSSNNTDQAIIIEGYAEGPASVSNSWGFYTHLSVIQNTGGGNIHIKGSAVKNSGVTVAGNGAVLANSGNIILEGIAAGDTNPNVLIQGAVGQKAGSDVTSSNADIEIIGDRFSITGTTPDGSIQSSGGLAIRPYTGETDIGIGSAAGTLQLPASYFNTNFGDGFAEILVGDENAGLITVEGATVYRDPLTLKTNGSIVFTSDADVSSTAANALTLWSRASGNNEADDAVNGTIWMPKGSSIHTGGGDLTMGGGSDPYVGYAKGDNSAPAGENNARYRGVAMNGTVNAAGGNIIINGRATNNATHARGVNIAGPVVTEGAGTITVRGIGVGSSDAIALGDSWFSPDAVGALETETGDISLDGKPSGSTRNGLNVSTSGSYIKTNGNFSATTTGRLTATFGALNIGGNTSLEAVDNITFTHVDNDFGGSITVNSAADLQVTDQNELTLGVISVSGIIDIATLGGDLTITENISTTNATADAIQIFADKNKHAGDPSGGNIKISNTPVISTGTGGQARLYSGSTLESADLITLAGEENTRYEVDFSTTVFDPVLGSGNYALIREEYIPLSNNADLASLSLSEGTLLPGFDSGTISYSSEVAYQTESITITPTTSDQAASVTVNGVAVASGNESSDVPLLVGANTITIEVTAEDGVTTLTYSIEVTRNHPFAGGEGTEASPYQIATAEQLDYVRDFLDDGFILTSDIDLGVFPWNDGEGWEPIGTDIDTFKGALEGNGHTISNLFIDRVAGYAGLFGYIGEGGLVTNIHIKNANVTSTETRVGILAGYLDGDVSKIALSGTVSGNGRVGGLAGAAELNSTITNVSADITSTSTDERAGGLLGSNRGDISNSYAYGSVTGSARVGGLIGNNHSGTVSNNYVAVELNGGGWTRGLVGDNAGGTYSNNFVDEDVANSASSGNGIFRSTGEMKTKSTFTDAGWNFDTVWQIDEPGSGNISYPYLQNNTQDPAPGYYVVTLPVVSTGTDNTSITDSSAIVTGNVTDEGNLTISDRGFVWSVAANPDILDNVESLGTGSGNFSKTVENLPPGTTIYVRAYATNQLGTSYGNEESFETEKKELTISGSFVVSDKVYDGDTIVEVDQNNLTLDTIFAGHDVTLTSIDAGFTHANVGLDISVTINLAELSGADADRYTLSLTNAPTALANITTRPITVTADAQQVIYGEADPTLSYEITSGSLVTGDELSGGLERVAGFDVGTYAIQQGTLSAGSNYDITYVGADFSILRTPPVVVQRSPGEDEGRVAIDAVITAEFDHDITVADAGLMTLTGPDATTSPLTVSVDGPVLKLTHGGLSHHTGYTLAIGENALENVDGVGNKAATWSFTTIMAAPVAETLSPVDGATEVDLNDPLSVTFSQDVMLADASGISIVSGQGRSTADIQADLLDNVLTISHGGLDPLTEYTISVPQGTVQNTDGVENDLFSWSFTSIVPVPDPVVLTSPIDQQGSVALNSEFKWEPTSHAAFYRIQVSDEETFGTPLEDVDQLTDLTFTPAEPLGDYRTYFWRVKAVNDAGESDWSDVNRFTTIAKTPLAMFPLMDSQNISIAPMPEWNSEYHTSYRVQIAGSEAFDSPVADSLTSNRAVQITGLNEDADYFWRVRVETDSTESSWTNAIRFKTRPAASTEDDEQVVDHSVTFGETSNQDKRVISELDYRMVGLPGNDHHGVEDFFEGKYGREWKVFYENGKNTEYYDEYKQGDDRFLFAPGRGFWVLSTDVMNLDLKITSVTTNGRDAYSVPLHLGWNIITNPHRGPVSWSEVQEMNDFSGDAWGYDQRFVLADTLHPVQGYYVYNHPDQPRDYLDIPYATMKQRRSEVRGKALLAASSTTPVPAVNLSAEFEEKGRFGTQILYPDLAGRQDGGEALDAESLRRYYPSLEMSRSGMMLVNNDHVARGGLLRDVSRFDADGAEYELHLKGETGQRFNWKLSLQNMPEQTRALIVNPTNSKTWLLKHGEEMDAILTEPNAVYELYTGDRDRLEQLQKDLMPQEFALEPNYPNPFNPMTNIRYSLPDQQHVKLEVYDVIGRRVQVLTNDVQQPGWHVVQFDGSRLASGVYLYRLTTDNNVKVRKMTLVK